MSTFFNPQPKPVKQEKPKRASSFQRKPGKEYKGFSQGRGFTVGKGAGKVRSDVFVDEAGDAHYTGHQDPHGVYRDVDDEAVRGGVRVFDGSTLDEHGEVRSSDRPKPEPRKRMAARSKTKKPRAGEDGRYLAACRGEPCYLRVPGVCKLNPADETVVPCHSNQSKHGKAGALKADDKFSVPGCFWCHAWLDQNTTGATYEQKCRRWDAAYRIWKAVRDHKMGLSEIPVGVTV